MCREQEIANHEGLLEPPKYQAGVPYLIYDGGLRFNEQSRRIGIWPIDTKMHKLVVDVGCGHFPFPYANILVDKDPWEAKERFGYEIPRDGRQLLAGDLEKGLPFKDKEVDFIYCSHVLEHCENPGVACSEILRVAKSGFIETPNVNFELILGGYESSPHKWTTDFEYDSKILTFRKLTFQEKAIIQRRISTGNIIPKLFRDPIKPHRCHSIAYWQNQEMFTNCFLWQDSFNYIVIK